MVDNPLKIKPSQKVNNPFKYIILISGLLISSGALAGIITAEHRVLEANDNKLGDTQLELAITLTNHGGKDIEHAHFHFENAHQLNLFSRISPLLIEKIPAMSSITVTWKVEGKGKPIKWQLGKDFSLTGQGVVEDDFMVPLKIFSESIVSLD